MSSAALPPAPSENGPSGPLDVDHLIYACSTLERGMDEMEALLGVRPTPGGQHREYGTHNALLALGPQCYLEVMAPDPSLPRPEQGGPFEVEPGRPSKLAAWVLRRENIEESAARARTAGVAIGELKHGGRRQPDGSMLSWRLSDPYAKLLDGVVPFLIAWGDTPHPAQGAPSGGELLALSIHHPQPGRVLAALNSLGVEVPVRKGRKCRLIAEIVTAGGTSATLGF